MLFLRLGINMTLELVATTPNKAPRAKTISSAPQTLMAESNHRIANTLGLIAGLVRLRASTLTRQKTMRGDSSWKVGERELLIPEPVVQIPEAPLLARGLRCPRDPLRAGVRPLVRKMAEGDPQAPSEHLAQLLEDWTKPTAIGAQKIAVEDDAHHPVAGIATAHVIATTLDRSQKPVGAARAHG
jgi:hypothetical protein